MESTEINLSSRFCLFYCKQSDLVTFFKNVSTSLNLPTISAKLCGTHCGALNGPLHLQSDSVCQCELSQGTKQADNLIRTRIEVTQNLFSPI